MIKCVILDCDGTMFDTERLAKKAYEDFASQHGVNLDQEFWRGICGTGLEFAKPQLDRFPIIRDNIKEISALRLKNITHGSASKDNLVKKGLYDLLDYCKENQIKVAIASSSHFDYVNMLLDHMSKPYEFDFILCGDMITHKKPDPEIFNTVIEKLNVKPEETLILEDSLMGLIAAKEANAIAGFIEDQVIKNEKIEELLDVEFPDFTFVPQYLV
ncbi:HAD family hydrolase [Anaerorhabdus furcosa]|uniref:Haloacid dehalogenase superfamily, subfamily IA, variant 3 with third motif having DD or ED/haloacid dehalogenase superfamily, subfamily IA, variant 1 with third motif having Dx(3-4)D or Dx(3-4)E n=1 Tax=Anaerorhabdus furcosa TaxID=118967 RepID=A0A1T4NIY2_9FIRM|nr:HAD family phosphatase [Anaerorhabdus furcosa]SJZ79281.1 haloacid dehalogenase superfamily, subfamily IA, variant 3 with third motif having DD or ED/haloacid dehalogenase superfamily, subfamily IA, variant 1 with third motif having Dx(3-4)D or Dx(3-4)E [Anaerorhabdus furcosa]